MPRFELVFLGQTTEKLVNSATPGLFLMQIFKKLAYTFKWDMNSMQCWKQFRVSQIYLKFILRQ
jgi:hypothetical protein